MGTGYPDWARIKKKGAVGSMGDLGELAVRMGSIVSFDRRGDVIFLDTFEDGLAKWLLAPWAVGGSVGLSAEVARSGGLSARVESGTQAVGYSTIYHCFGYPVVSSLGVECSFCVDTDLEWIGLDMELFNGSRRYYGFIRYKYTSLALQYLGADDVWVDLRTGVDLCQEAYVFATWKLVADFRKGEYVRVILNEVEFDLSRVDLFSADNADSAVLKVSVMVGGQDGVSSVAHVDDVIVTQNEP